jgi:hypothetical protein
VHCRTLSHAGAPLIIAAVVTDERGMTWSRVTFPLALVSLCLMLVGCHSGNDTRKASRFDHVQRWESALYARLDRRFRQPVGQVHCTSNGVSSPDHLFCQATFPATTEGKCDTRAYDVAGDPRSLVVRSTTESWYCIVNTSARLVNQFG